MPSSGGRSRRLAVAALIVVAAGAALLQILNTLAVRRELLGGCVRLLGDERCEVRTTLASVDLAVDASGIRRDVRLSQPRLVADTGFVRTSCAGSWVVGFGGRGDVRDLEIATEALAFHGGRGCIDMGRAGATARFVDSRFTAGNCTVPLTPLEFGAEDTMVLRVGSAVDAVSLDACRGLMPHAFAGAAGPIVAEARIELATSDVFGSSFDAGGGPVAPDADADDAAAGVVRRVLRSGPTSHQLRASLEGGSVAVHLRTQPVDDSVILSLTVEANGGIAERYLLEVPSELAGKLELQWTLDHRSGTVRMNGTEIRRIPPTATRPAGRVVLSSSECAKSRAARALYFVEADDSGQALDPSQLEGVFAALDAAVSDRGVLVAVFVHGWQHSAAPGDSYVCGYSDVLASVEEMEVRAAALSGRAPRQVLGVYVGWPGALYPNELANTATTFWNRLDAADRLGGPDALLQRLLSGLSQRLAGRTTGAAADRRSLLLVVGHSMGARAVFAALGGDTFGASNVDSRAASDLVLLVNPAFSASLYRAVSDRNRECRPGTPLLLFSSEADAVTRQLYPAGQTVTYPYGSARPAPFLEHIYTAANFAAFVTHRLTLEVVAGEPPDPAGPQTILAGFARVPSGSRELYEDNPVQVYRQSPAGRPRAEDVWYRMRLVDAAAAPSTSCEVADGGSAVIAVDRGILPDHGRIFTPPFVEYVVRVLNRRAAASLTGR